jgi:hypothetical protein
LHFGLGTGGGAASIEVRWPSGRIDRYTGLPVDRGYHLHEGDGTARPLAGFGKSSASNPIAGKLMSGANPPGVGPARPSNLNYR